jgi:hypothetical protein
MKAPKIAITEAPIHVFKPMSEGQPFLARIARLPMIFEAPTAIGAKKAAVRWVAEEHAKHERAKMRAAERASPRREAGE